MYSKEAEPIQIAYQESMIWRSSRANRLLINKALPLYVWPQRPSRGLPCKIDLASFDQWPPAKTLKWKDGHNFHWSMSHIPGMGKLTSVQLTEMEVSIGSINSLCFIN